MGLDSRITGAILLTTPLIMVLMSPIGERLADRMDERVLSGFVMIILLLVILDLCFVEILPLPALIVVMIIQGIGYGLFSPPNNRYVLKLVDDKDLSDSSSMLITSKEVGKTISLAMYNVICVLMMGNQVITDSYLL